MEHPAPSIGPHIGPFGSGLGLNTLVMSKDVVGCDEPYDRLFGFAPPQPSAKRIPLRATGEGRVC
jgi:hypothetical protein